MRAEAAFWNMRFDVFGGRSACHLAAPCAALLLDDLERLPVGEDGDEDEEDDALDELEGLRREADHREAGVEVAMTKLREEFGDEKFSKVFKTMTADNGPEFETFSQYEQLGTKIYFTHPYSSWERPQNERHNGLLRDYIPKGTSIERYSDEDVLSIADELNQRPRRIMGYHTPAELFDHFLDEVYAIDKCS